MQVYLKDRCSTAPELYQMDQCLLHIDRGEGERGREGDTYPMSSLCSMNESISC